MAKQYQSGKFITCFQPRETSISWILENFSLCDKKPGEYLESEVFPKLDGDSCEWFIKLYPYGEDKNSKDNISIYLVLISETKSDVLAYFKFNFQNMDEKLIETSDYTSSRLDVTWGDGFSEFVSRRKVIDNLVKDTLIINCTVKWQENVLKKTLTVDNEDKTVKLVVQNSILNDLHQLMREGTLSDVSLLAKDNIKLAAHKCILAARSPVFAAMFQHDMKERQQSLVKINDMNGDTLKSVLEFMYSGKFVNYDGPVEEILIAADKYTLDDLKQLCERDLIQKLSIENAVDYLLLADKYCAKALKERVLNLIATNLKDVLRTEAMKNLSITDAALFYEIVEVAADKM